MAFDKAALRKEIDRDHKRKARERLAVLRAKLRSAREAKKAVALEVKHKAADMRRKLSERIKELRRRARVKLNEIAKRERNALRATVAEMRAKAKRSGLSLVEVAREELKAERHWQRELARIERAHRARLQAHPHASAKTRRQESDDEVRANIPADHRALFERVKSKIRGNAKQSRTEAFFRYVEEHPDEHLHAIEHEAMREVRKLERLAWEEAQQAKRKGPRKTSTRRREELDAVPF